MDAKAEAKGGGGAKGGGSESKGGGGGAKAEAKGGGGRALDSEVSDSDWSSSSNAYKDVKNIGRGDVCIVKRSDGTWKYAKFSSWDGILLEVEVDDDENCKMFQIDEDDMENCEVKALDCARGAK